MRLRFISLSLFLVLSISLAAQSEQEAIKILDRFSSNALGAPSVSMKFNLITVDQAENTKDTLKGSIILSRDKYNLELPDNTIWFNGDISWSYLPAEKEVTITKPDRKDNSFQNRPSSIFSMYKNGYKCRLIEDKSDSWTIDLYPEDIKSDLLRVRLLIGKSLLNLRSLEYKKRDGVVITLNVVDYNLKQKPVAETFVYPAAKFKGVEVVDMR
ncbi:MAG: outer membrane lipoprotein carrier protein LolA [Bacteroidales bacterium]|nr:outer membrane lipoprotein carrier protein LolA [Bacteroidales bacterium]